jgi:putative hemolysin
MWLDLAYALPIAAALVIVAGLFSGTEVAVFSLRRTDRDQMSKSGRAADKSVLALLAQPRRLIVAVLIGIESIIGSLVVVMLGIVALGLDGFTHPPWVWGGVTLAITLPLVVLLGEVVPKTLALKNPIGWSRIAAWPLAMFALAMTPVRWIVSGATSVVLRPLGSAGRSKPAKDLTKEEFKSLVDVGSATGQVDARERRLIHRVFDFADKNVGQIMTPRERMFALSYDLPMARLAKEVATRAFSRVPIYQKSVDNVRGILNAKDLIRVQAGVAAGRTLGELLHEPLFVPRTTPVKRLFVTFKQKKVHMGVVVNEYGKVLGLVTMDDVLAQLFGALRDERDAQRGRGRERRTPVPGVPQAPAGRFESGPVGRVDPADLTPVPGRDPAELTPPELTPPPSEVPAAIQAMANKLATSRPITEDPEPEADAPKKKRATTKDEDDADETSGGGGGGRSGGGDVAASDGGAGASVPMTVRAGVSAGGHGGPGNATPVPITDSDTGPSGPVKLPGRRER